MDDPEVTDPSSGTALCRCSGEEKSSSVRTLLPAGDSWESPWWHFVTALFVGVGAVLILGGSWYSWQGWHRSSHVEVVLPPEVDSYRSFPPGVWSSVKVGVENNPSDTESEDGWSRLPQWGTFSSEKARGTNWGLRATFRHPHEKRPPQLRLREDRFFHYRAFLDDGGEALTIQRFENKTGRHLQTLGKASLPEPITRSQPYTLEFFAIRQRLIARVNGFILDLMVPEAPMMGRASIQGIWRDAFREVLHLNLDGVPDDRAFLLIGLSHFVGPPLPSAELKALLRPITTVPLPPSSPDFPSGKWKSLRLDPAIQPFLIEPDPGWFTSTSGVSILPTSVQGKQWGIRATFRHTHRAQVPELRLRSSGDANFNAFLENNGQTLMIQRFDRHADKHYLTLGQLNLERPVPPGTAYMLEFFAIGQTLLLRYQNHLLEIHTDILPIAGRANIYGIHFDQIRDVELMNLEGFSETEALQWVRGPVKADR